jgi:hypothetical protein
VIEANEYEAGMIAAMPLDEQFAVLREMPVAAVSEVADWEVNFEDEYNDAEMPGDVFKYLADEFIDSAVTGLDRRLLRQAALDALSQSKCPVEVIGDREVLSDDGHTAAATAIGQARRVLDLLDERYPFAKRGMRERLFWVGMGEWWAEGDQVGVAMTAYMRDHEARADEARTAATAIALAWQIQIRKSWHYVLDWRTRRTCAAQIQRSKRRPPGSARCVRNVRRTRTVRRSGCSPGRPGRSTDDNPLPPGRLQHHELVLAGAAR